MRPFTVELAETDVIQAFNSVRHLPYSLLLDSSDPKHPNSRYSYVICAPFEAIEAKDGVVTVRNLHGEERFETDPFAVIQERMDAFSDQIETIKGLPPFQGGAAGLFGYDLGRYLEDLPDEDLPSGDIPDMAVGLYDQVIAFDHELDKAWLVTQATDEAEARIKQRVILKALERQDPPLPIAPAHLDWESNMDAEEYEAAITKVLDYIYKGEVYQANIAQRFEAALPGGFDPYAHYLKLRAVNPAPYAAYFNLGTAVISSASPEQFLSVKGNQVQTKPIKGTRPRSDDKALDNIYKDALLSSEKDRAENIMIVDLMRNDISKVCRSHSVKVSKLCALESFASVHHLVSTVNGVLEAGKNSVDLLRACFPGGSITGAPKIRAQGVIEEIETVRRGPYCGSIGYIGFDGAMDSSILIRTLVYEGDTVSLSVGSGIVADSNADDEYQECFDKAEAMFRSFNGLEYEIEEEYLMAMVAE